VTCTHGMPTPASCLDCMDEIGFGATPTAAERLEGPKMNARHEGLCGDPGCINLIAPGCTIHLTTLGRWVCSDCADQLKEKR